MRTRSQAAASASPLQSLSQQPKRERRARVKKTEKAPSPAPSTPTPAAIATTTKVINAAKVTKKVTKKVAKQDEPVERPTRRRKVRAPPSEPSPVRTTQLPQLSGEELLRHIENAREECRRIQYGRSARAAEEKHDTEILGNEENIAPEEPPRTPPAAIATPSATPRSTGWGFRSLFSSILPKVFAPSPAAATPTPTAIAPVTTTSSQQNQQSPMAQTQQLPQAQETQPAQPVTPTLVVLQQAQVDAIGAALTPTPAVRASSTRVSKSTVKRRPRVTKRNSTQNAVVATAVRNVREEEKALAAAWAEKAAEKLSEDATTIGSKRRQLEQPMKLKDVKVIPARRPWEPTGSYGLLPEFFDDSDSDEEAEAPGWYLVDQLINEQPPLKKRKTVNGSPGSEMSISPIRTPKSSPQPIVDSQGHSAKINDIHPRPSTVPSPMFDNPATHREGSNVFEEHQDHTAPAGYVVGGRTFKDRDEFLKELRRTGHVPGSGSFCVPEPDSEDSDSDVSMTEDSTMTSTSAWTQPPPPAPTPAHATLPAQPTEVPAITPIPQVDPLEAQRAKAMKHTPAKQSRLREVMVPSPSLKSDVGGSPFAATPTPTAAVQIVDEDGIPDPIPLDLGDDDLLNFVTQMVASAEYAALNRNAYLDDMVELTYDDFDLISEEGDDEL